MNLSCASYKTLIIARLACILSVVFLIRRSSLATCLPKMSSESSVLQKTLLATCLRMSTFSLSSLSSSLCFGFWLCLRQIVELLGCDGDGSCKEDWCNCIWFLFLIQQHLVISTVIHFIQLDAEQRNNRKITIYFISKYSEYMNMQ